MLNKVIGIIKEPSSTIKTKVFEIWGNQNNLKFKVVADYYQIGICWRNSLYGQCFETHYSIIRVIENKDEETRGIITKRFSACSNDDILEYPEALEIIFPETISSIDKLLISLCGLIIDYRFYEINPRDSKEG